MPADPQIVEGAGKFAWGVVRVLIPALLIIGVIEVVIILIRKKLRNISNKLKLGNTENCPRCGGKLVEKNGKFGPFLGCLNYPKCNFTKDL
jgi:hypothetical protein